MATSFGDPANTLEAGGGYLPSLAGANAAGPAGAMASDFTESCSMVEPILRRSGRLGCVAR